MDEEAQQLSHELHDATLLSIAVDWPKKAAILELKALKSLVTVEVSGLRSLAVPRDDPWGPSDQVNSVVWVHSHGPAPATVEIKIEMQSGDVIRMAGALVTITRAAHWTEPSACRIWH